MPVFKDPALNERLIEEADADGRSTRLPHSTLHRLNTDPRAIGPLRGSLLDDKRETKLSAKELAVRLEARAEMRATQNKYDKLWRQADAAERLPSDEEAQQLEHLRSERATCDAARDSREIEFRDAMAGLRRETEDSPQPEDPKARWMR